MPVRNMLVLILLCSTTLPVGAAPPLAKHLSESTICYAGWSGRSLVFDGSAFGQMLSEPGIGRFLGAMKSLAETTLPANRSASLTHALAMGSLAWQHPAAIALSELEPGDNGPEISAVVLIELARDGEAFQKHLDAFIESLENVTVTEKSEGGLPYRSIAGPNGSREVVVGFKGDLFFMATGPEAARRIIGLKPEQSLATSKKFTSSMAAVGGENIQIAFYLDVPELLKRTEAILAGKAPTAPDAGLSELRRIINALGLGQLEAVAGTTRIVDRGMLTRTRLFSPSPHRGLLLPLAGQELTDADLAHVPDDADFVAAIKLSGETLHAEILHSLDVYSAGKDKDLKRQFSEYIGQLEERIGVSITQDLLPALGDTVVVSSASSQGGFATGTVLSITMKDAAKVAEVIAKIESYAGENLPPTISLETAHAGRIEIRYLAGQFGMPWPVAPAWAIHEDRLLIAGWPQVLKTILDRGGDIKQLSTSTGFAKHRSRVAKNASVLSYTNTPQIMRQMYPSLIMLGTMGTNALAMKMPVGAKPDWVPALSTLEKYLWPNIMTVSSDETGITFETYGSVPGMAPLLSPLNTAVSAGIVLPSLQLAKRRTKELISKTHMEGLYLACLLYAENNNGASPPDFAALIGGRVQYVDEIDMFISPLSGRPTPGIIDGQFTGAIDYIYINPGNLHTIERPATLLLAYERSENYGGKKTIALFADGHIEQVSMIQLEAAIQLAKEHAKKATGSTD